MTLALGLRAPAYGLAVLVVTDPFPFTHAVGHTTVTGFKVALLGLLAALAWRRELTLPRAGPAFAIACALLALVAATAATIPHAAFQTPAVRETFKAIQYALVFLVCWSAAHTDSRAVRALAYACAATAILVGLAALGDYAHPQSGVWIGGHPYTRLAGALEGPNQLAAWLALALAPVAALAPPPLLEIALGVTGAILALTFSRGGIAQAALTLAGALAARPDARRRAAAVAVLSCAGAFAAFSLLMHGGAAFARITSPGASVDLGGTGSRAILWDAALAMFRAHPLLGVGAGNFELELPAYGAPPTVRTHANSLYFESLADGGVVLAAAMLAASLIPPLVLLRGRPRTALMLAAGTAGLALALHGAVDDVMFYTKVGQFWWLVVGVAAAAASPALLPAAPRA